METALHFIVCIIITIVVTFQRVESTGLLNTDLDLSQPISFKDLEGTKFRIYKRRFGWEAALIFCSRCVGNLAVFDTPESVTTVRDVIYNFSHFSLEYDEGLKQEEFGLDRRYWIGLHDHKNEEGTWKWIKNTREYPVPVVNENAYPWYTNQPDHREPDTSNPTEHCGGFWNPVYHLDTPPTRLEKHTLNDFPCQQNYYFICEKSEPPPYSGPEPQYCQHPVAENFGRLFGNEEMFTVEKFNKYLEKESVFQNSTI